MIMPILIGLTLILRTFISTVSLVEKMAYVQARMGPSNNGVTAPKPHDASVDGRRNEPGRNSAVQGVAGAS
jgi:hypothetical protein